MVFGFFKRRKNEPENINVEEIDSWFLRKTNSKTKKFREEVSQIYDNLIFDTKLLRKNQNIILHTEIPEVENKKVERIKMQKELYLKNLFDLEKDLVLKENINLNYAHTYSTDKEKSIQSFLKRTLPGYQFLKEHYQDELSKTSLNLKSIKDSLTKLKEISSNEEIKKIEKTTEKIKKMVDLVERKNDYEDLIAESEKKYDVLKRERKELELKSQQLKNGKEQKELDNMLKELDEKEKKLKQLKHDFNKKIEFILENTEKYGSSNEFSNELITQYKQDAEKAISSDKNLEIIHIVSDIKKEIERKNITKKEEKTIKRLQLITQDYFKELLSEKLNLEFDVSGLKRRSDSMNVKFELSDIEYKKTHAEDKLKKISKETAKLVEEIEKTDVESLKDEIEQNIIDIIGEKIIIEINLTDSAENTEDSDKENK